MSKTKAAQIAAHLNAFYAERPFDYRQIAEAKAFELGVGLYWSGTAAPEPNLPSAEVWQTRNGQWIKRIGSVTLGHDNIWR